MHVRMQVKSYVEGDAGQFRTRHRPVEPPLFGVIQRQQHVLTMEAAPVQRDFQRACMGETVRGGVAVMPALESQTVRGRSDPDGNPLRGIHQHLAAR